MPRVWMLNTLMIYTLSFWCQHKVDLWFWVKYLNCLKNCKKYNWIFPLFSMRTNFLQTIISNILVVWFSLCAEFVVCWSCFSFFFTLPIILRKLTFYYNHQLSLLHDFVCLFVQQCQLTGTESTQGYMEGRNHSRTQHCIEGCGGGGYL